MPIHKSLLKEQKIDDTEEKLIKEVSDEYGIDLTKYPKKSPKVKGKRCMDSGVYEARRALNKKLFVKYYVRCFGNVHSLCKSLGLSTSSFYNYYYKDSEFKAQIDELTEKAQNTFRNFTFNQYMKLIAKGNDKAILNEINRGDGVHYTPQTKQKILVDGKEIEF